MAPTYFRREPGIDAPTAIAAPRSRLRSMAQSTSIEDAKATLRRQARARRDALPAGERAEAFEQYGTSAASHDVADEEDAHPSHGPAVDDLALG